ncbi:MAG: MFS transporter, partial [Ilumatobacter sp.]
GLLDSVGAGVIASLGDIGSAGVVHGSYGLGATLGPLVVVVVPDWRWSIVVTALVAACAVAVAIVARDNFPAPPESPIHSPNEEIDPSDRPGRPPTAATAVSLLAFFAFVAIEVTIGSWLFTYLTEARDVDDTVARLAVSGFWGGSMAGRLVLVSDRVRAIVERLGLPAAASIAAAFVGVTTIAPGATVVAASTAVGLGLAPIVPTLSARTSQRVGLEHAQQVSGWQLLAANVGAIGVPYLTGAVIDATTASAVLVVALAVLAFGIPLLIGARRLTVRPTTTPTAGLRTP